VQSEYRYLQGSSLRRVPLLARFKSNAVLVAKASFIVVLFAMFLPGIAMAQGPATPARAPLFDVGAGYSFVSLPLGNNRVSLNGANANLSAYVSTYLGIKLDVGYTRDNNVFNTGHNSDVLSYLAGPVIYPFRGRRSALYVEGLFGAARVTGPVPAAGGTLLIHGYANKFAWAAGGGVEYKLGYRFFRSLTFRAGGDYLHTAYFTPTSAVSGQNDARIIANLVYTFGSRNR
jgi:hypothetical protein